MFWAHFWGFHFACKKKSSGRILSILASKNEGISREVQMHFGSSLPASFTESYWRNFTSCASKNEAVCCEVQTHFGSPLPCKVYKKGSGRIFSIFSSKSEAVCRWVQMHSGCSLLARFTVKSSRCNFTIYDLCVQNEAVCCWVQTHFGSFRLASLIKKFWAHFLDFCVQKPSYLLWSSDACWKFPARKVYRKKFRTQCHDICVEKRRCLPWSSDASWKFSPCKVYTKSSGSIFLIFASKNEAFCCEVQTQFYLFALHALYKMFWTLFHDLCVQKRSCLPWSSDAFWKFTACKFYRKGSGRNSTICESKNEAVCCEVQTHFGSFRLSSFIKNVLGAFSRFMRPKMKLFAVESDVFWKFSACEFTAKVLGAIPRFVPKNEAVCREIQTHSGSSLPARFAEKVLGPIPRFVRRRTKLFAVKSRRILEILCLHVLQKKLWEQFHNLCV